MNNDILHLLITYVLVVVLFTVHILFRFKSASFPPPLLSNRVRK